ncbi:hypothetical protein HK096_007663, partial [Nowakowskiella sp. JEL0078]
PKEEFGKKGMTKTYHFSYFAAICLISLANAQLIIDLENIPAFAEGWSSLDDFVRWGNLFSSPNNWDSSKFSAFRNILLNGIDLSPSASNNRPTNPSKSLLEKLRLDLVLSSSLIKKHTCARLLQQESKEITKIDLNNCPMDGVFSNEFWKHELNDKAISIGILSSSCNLNPSNTKATISKKLLIEVSGCSKLGAVDAPFGRHPGWVNTFSISTSSQIELFNRRQPEIISGFSRGRSVTRDYSVSGFKSCDRVCEDGSVSIIDEWIKLDLETNPTRLVLFSDAPFSDCTAGYLVFSADIFADSFGRTQVDFISMDHGNIWNDDSIALIVGDSNAVCPFGVETGLQKLTSFANRPFSLRKRFGEDGRRCEKHIDEHLDALVFKNIYEKYFDKDLVSLSTQPWPSIYDIWSANLFSMDENVDHHLEFIANLTEQTCPSWFSESQNRTYMQIRSPLIIPPFNDFGPNNITDLFSLLEFSLKFTSINPLNSESTQPTLNKNNFPLDLQFLGDISTQDKLLTTISDSTIESISSLCKECNSIEDISYFSLYKAISEVELRPCKETVFGGIGERLSKLTPVGIKMKGQQKGQSINPKQKVQEIDKDEEDGFEKDFSDKTLYQEGTFEEDISSTQNKTSISFLQCKQNSRLEFSTGGDIEWTSDTGKREFENEVLKVRSMNLDDIGLNKGKLRFGIRILVEGGVYFERLNITSSVGFGELAGDGVAIVQDSKDSRNQRSRIHKIGIDKVGRHFELLVQSRLRRQMTGATHVRIQIFDPIAKGSFKRKIQPIGSFKAVIICDHTSPVLQGRYGVGIDNPMVSIANAASNAASASRRGATLGKDESTDIPDGELHFFLSLFRDAQNVKLPVEVPLRWHIVSHNLAGYSDMTPYLRESLAYILPQSTIFAFQNALRLESLDDIFYSYGDVEMPDPSHSTAATEDKTTLNSAQRMRILFELTDSCGVDGWSAHDKLRGIEQVIEEMMMGTERIVFRSDLFNLVENCVLHSAVRRDDSLIEGILEKYIHESKDLTKSIRLPSVVILRHILTLKKFVVVNVRARNSQSLEIDFLLSLLEYLRISYGLPMIVTGSFAADFNSLVNKKLIKTDLFQQFYPVSWTNSHSHLSLDSNLFSPFTQVWFPDLPLSSQLPTTAISPFAYLRRDKIDRTKLCMVIDEEISSVSLPLDTTGSTMQTTASKTDDILLRLDYCRDLIVFNKWFAKNIGSNLITHDRIPARYETCASDYSGHSREDESFTTHFPVTYNLTSSGQIYKVVSFNLNGLGIERAKRLSAFKNPSRLFNYLAKFDIVVLQGEGEDSKDLTISEIVRLSLQKSSEIDSEVDFQWRHTEIVAVGPESHTMQIYWRDSTKLRSLQCAAAPYSITPQITQHILGCVFESSNTTSPDPSYFLLANIHDHNLAPLTNPALDLSDSNVNVMKRLYQVLCRSVVSSSDEGLEIDAEKWCKGLPMPAAFIGSFNSNLRIKNNSTWTEFKNTVDGMTKEIIRKNQIGDRKFPQGYNSKLQIQAVFPPESLEISGNPWVPMSGTQNSGVMGWLFRTSTVMKLWPYWTTSKGEVSDFMIIWSESNNQVLGSLSESFVIADSARIDPFLSSAKCNIPTSHLITPDSPEDTRVRTTCFASDPPCIWSSLSKGNVPIGVKVMGAGRRRIRGVNTLWNSDSRTSSQCVASKIEDIVVDDALSAIDLGIEEINLHQA